MKCSKVRVIMNNGSVHDFHDVDFELTEMDNVHMSEDAESDKDISTRREWWIDPYYIAAMTMELK